MRLSVWLASAALAIVGFCNAGHGQTSIAPKSIASFEDVAGKWVGHANNYNASLEIDTTGGFTARYALGGESGEATLEGGALLIPLPAPGLTAVGLGRRNADWARPDRRQEVEGEPRSHRSGRQCGLRRQAPAMINIRIGYELLCDFPQPTPLIMVLGTHFSRASDIRRAGLPDDHPLRDGRTLSRRLRQLV
jgi:hypothetical protein